MVPWVWQYPLNVGGGRLPVMLVTVPVLDDVLCCLLVFSRRSTVFCSRLWAARRAARVSLVVMAALAMLLVW